MKPLNPLLCCFALAASLLVSNCCAADATDKISAIAESLREKLIATRRELHTHPELSNRETNTARFVAKRLAEIGFTEIQTNVAGNGILALLKGTKPGPVVAWRCDLDALPITESNSVPYRSQNSGVMHACGHDVHMTVALGVAEVLSRMRHELRGSVKFLFQPAEEGAPEGEEGGAPLMIQRGALENPKPDAIFALHVSPGLDAGTIGYRSGPAQASIDTFTITVRGKVPFAGAPEEGVDTVLVAAQCVNALQSIKSRRISSFEPVILTIGSIHGGKRPFNTPPEVKLEGCLRTFNEELRKKIHQQIRETLAGTTAVYGATFDFETRSVTAVVVNDPKLVANSLPAIQHCVGATNVVELPLWMGGEDFSYYGQIVPAFMFRLGCGNKARGITSNIHTATFDVDENCIEVGVKTAASVLWNFLERQ